MNGEDEGVEGIKGKGGNWGREGKPGNGKMGAELSSSVGAGGSIGS